MNKEYEGYFNYLKELSNKIEQLPSNVTIDRDILYLQHETTVYKIKAARYFMNKMRELLPVREAISLDDINVFSFQVDAFLLTLSSTLDSLGAEINLVYNLEYNKNEIYFDGLVKDRRLISLESDLQGYLEEEIYQSWYSYFRTLRNQTAHRLFPFYAILPEGPVQLWHRPITTKDVYFPDDIRAQPPHFDKRIRVISFCERMLENVMQLLLKSYRFMETRLL